MPVSSPGNPKRNQGWQSSLPLPASINHPNHQKRSGTQNHLYISLKTHDKQPPSMVPFTFCLASAALMASSAESTFLLSPRLWSSEEESRRLRLLLLPHIMTIHLTSWLGNGERLQDSQYKVISILLNFYYTMVRCTTCSRTPGWLWYGWMLSNRCIFVPYGVVGTLA